MIVPFSIEFKMHCNRGGNVDVSELASFLQALSRSSAVADRPRDAAHMSVCCKRSLAHSVLACSVAVTYSASASKLASAASKLSVPLSNLTPPMKGIPYVPC